MIFVPLFLFWFKRIDCGERGHGEYFEKKGEHCLLETGNSILTEALGADLKGLRLESQLSVISKCEAEVRGLGKSELQKMGVWGARLPKVGSQMALWNVDLKAGQVRSEREPGRTRAWSGCGQARPCMGAGRSREPQEGEKARHRLETRVPRAGK